MSLPSLRLILSSLESLAPLSLAASWDNVGLLIAHSLPSEAPSSSPYNVLLTNDLTLPVLEHSLTAFDGGPANLIISYHPTPFQALKKFTLASPASRVVLTCAAHNIAVFSPHTSWDAAAAGLNDWLVEGIAQPLGGAVRTHAVKRSAGALDEGTGDGRIAVLAQPATLAQVIESVKAHLKLATVQVSLPVACAAAAAGGVAAVRVAAEDTPVTSIAVCAGSGGSVLGGLTSASVWVTGELSHHEVLAASAAGVAVILTNHSNCERGFLPHVAGRLQQSLLSSGADFRFLVSPVDADPLTTI